MDSSQKLSNKDIFYQPVKIEQWADLVEVFGTNGAYSGCWCMYWRLSRKVFDRQAGSENKKALKKLIEEGVIPGILLYVNHQPAGWCSIAPREDFPSLNRSPVLKKVDDQPVWSIVCFFLHKKFRNQGLVYHLIASAVDYAIKQNAKIIEAYPIITSKIKRSKADIYTGTDTIFHKMGFTEILRRSAKRSIMRYII
ncbi:MAG: GNAT family N-acetyltransferase [Spirochaetes bacterium]|nr:GNAT family N-acetyltransferase [Spirochaetota bacterium]